MTTNRSPGTTTRRAASARTAVRSDAGRASSARSFTKQALDMLRDEHQQVKKLFRDGEKAADDAQALQPIVEEACAALTRHAEIEEEFFYPALRSADDEGLIAEAFVEHNSAKQLIADLESMAFDDERYRATFKVLGEYVEHHIEEEENEIFPLARRAKADFEPLYEALSAKTGESGRTDAEAGEALARRAPQRRTGTSRGRSR